ncbi:acyl-CoA oxidase [Streptomyces sp. NPDC051567]|uniref:acyl-CoA oxidase n=1 Tax=Streptomyces sp. NPDC051567 TaxID=3365660 RepID=UPI0037994A90
MSPEPAVPPDAPGAGPLHRLVHGSCAPDYLRSLHHTLARPAPPPGTGAPPDPEQAVTRRLRALSRALPPARRILRDPDRLAALLAWTAVADPALTMAIVTHTVLGLGSMTHLSPDHEELKSEFDALEAGDTRGGYLITEAGQANSHLDTRTRATFDPGPREFVLTTPDPAAAKFCGLSVDDGPRTVVVLARAVVGGQDRGVFPFLVDITRGRGPLPGVAVSSRLEIGALPLGYAQVAFEGVRVPYARWLRDSASIDGAGAFHDPLGAPGARLQRSLCVGQGLWGTLPSAAAAVSRVSAVSAVRYARGRRTQARVAPGLPLLAYRTQQRAVLGALADSFALTCAAARARALLATALAPGPRNGANANGTDTGRAEDAGTGAAATDTAGTGASGVEAGFAPWSVVSRPLSAYKAHAVRAALRIIAECRRGCGFSGHLDVNRLAAYHGFHQAFEPAGGDSQLIFYDLGRALAADAPDPDAHPDAHPGPGPDPRPDAHPYPADLAPADPRWWPRTARAHQSVLTARLRAARDRRAAGGPAEFDLWNPLLAAAGELGELYGEALAAEDVPRALAGLGPHADTGGPYLDTGLRDALEALAALSGVRAAERWSGSLLTAGTLDAAVSASLPETADLLCDRIMPQLPLLEAAFAFPPDVMDTPLADHDYTRSLASRLTWRHGGTP